MDVKCPHCLTIKTIDKTDKNIQVRCATTEGGCGKKFYIKNNIVLPKQDIQDNNKTPQKTTIIHRPSKVSIPIDNVNWVLILKILDRGYSTIKNKPEVKAKKGGYYFDSLTWEAEIDKIKEIAKVMKLMGDEK